ncbi:hypothetical protein GF354_04795 [Candidatus Peregrinibacteria bacterium]|nr:hypothetical protein [Candidatus Peregrinibacteria bacterium]
MEDFLFYLQLLIKSVPSFNEGVEAIRNKYKCYPSTSMHDNRADLRDVRKLMEEHFIPDKEKYLDLVCKFIYTNTFSNKYLVRDCLNASEEHPRELVVTRPAITIHIFEKMNEEEWRDIWSKYIKEGHLEINYGDHIEGPAWLEKEDKREYLNKMSIEALKRPHSDIKKQLNFRLAFKLFGLRKNRVEISEILDKMASIKEECGISKKRIFTKEEVNQMISDFAKELEKL